MRSGRETSELAVVSFLCSQLPPHLQQRHVVRMPFCVERRVATTLHRLGTNMSIALLIIFSKIQTRNDKVSQLNQTKSYCTYVCQYCLLWQVAWQTWGTTCIGKYHRASVEQAVAGHCTMQLRLVRFLSAPALTRMPVLSLAVCCLCVCLSVCITVSVGLSVWLCTYVYLSLFLCLQRPFFFPL